MPLGSFLSNHAPGFVGRELGRQFPSQVYGRLPGFYLTGSRIEDIRRQVVEVTGDNAKAGEVLIAAGLKTGEAHRANIEVIADVSALPRRLRRQVEKGKTDQRVFVTHREGRNLFRPFNPREDTLTVNLTTLPEALSSSAEALAADQKRVDDIRAELGEQAADMRSTRERMVDEIQDQVDEGVVREARSLAHARWHHRLAPNVISGVVATAPAFVGRTVAGLFDKTFPVDHVGPTPFTWQGLGVFAAGWLAVGAFNRIVRHPIHVHRTNQQTERYRERHAHDRVVTISVA